MGLLHDTVALFLTSRGAPVEAPAPLDLQPGNRRDSGRQRSWRRRRAACCVLRSGPLVGQSRSLGAPAPVPLLSVLSVARLSGGKERGTFTAPGKAEEAGRSPCRSLPGELFLPTAWELLLLLRMLAWGWGDTGNVQLSFFPFCGR